MSDDARCKDALEKLARYRWDDPDAHQLARSIVERHRDTILAAFAAELPRFTGERTPEGAWRYFEELDRAWKRVTRELQRRLALTVHGGCGRLSVDARDGSHSFTLRSDVAIRGMAPVERFFDRAFAALELPVDDIAAANALLAQPHDIAAAATEVLWFAAPRPPRSAPRDVLLSWLLGRQLLGTASAAERAELDQLAVETLALARIPAAVDPPAADNDGGWARWLLAVDLALDELNRSLKPAAHVYIRLDEIDGVLQIAPAIELRGADKLFVDAVETGATGAALDALLARLGAPRERLQRAASALGPALDARLGEKLDHIHYFNMDALEAS